MDGQNQAVRRALAAAQRPVVVGSDAELERALPIWQGSRMIGLDTEFVRERTYRAELGLVQVSDGETAWLIDPLALDDPEPLAGFLRDARVEKVIHSGSEDFEVFFHHWGTAPKAALDSQIACALLGQSLQLGYHHAVDWLLGVEIEKDHTRSNWLRRPLSAGQQRYAALDVVLLPMMMQRLRPRLEELGRLEWLREEVERMAGKSTEDVPPDKAWKRIKGAGSLNARGRRTLFALAQWREETARDKNIARGFVAPDGALLAMSHRSPESPGDLKNIEGLHPRAIGRYGKTWLELIKSADSLPELPPLPELTPRQRKFLKAMRNRVRKVAKSLDIDAALLASRKQLERLIHSYSASGEIPERFTGWRMELVTRDLLEVLEA